jgi:hypothetical protein
MIRTHETNRPTGSVRVIIQLPHEDDAGTAGCLTGTGHVVYPRDASENSAFAISVKHYRVQRREHVSPTPPEVLPPMVTSV